MHCSTNKGEDGKTAKEVATFLATIFDFEQSEGEASIFVEKNIEVIKSKGLGRNGHIAFYTENIEIAIKYLEEKD